jgi:hypothetical protein
MAFSGARQLAGTALIVLSLAVLAYHQYGLAPRMAVVRETIHSREEIPEEEPARREFLRLRGVSMTLNLLMITAGAALVIGYETFRKCPSGRSSAHQVPRIVITISYRGDAEGVSHPGARCAMPHRGTPRCATGPRSQGPRNVVHNGRSRRRG